MRSIEQGERRFIGGWRLSSTLLPEQCLGGSRDGFLFGSASDRANVPAPLVVALHGAGQDGRLFDSVVPVVEKLGIILLVPESRGVPREAIAGKAGPDTEFLDKALAFAFDRCTIDSKTIALGGFCDGASCALSVGITN